MSVSSFFLLVRVLAEDGQVHVAVTGVPAAHCGAAGCCGQSAGGGKEFRHGAARDDGVDEVVGAHRLERPERVLARLDQLAGRAAFEDIGVEGAQLGDQFPGSLDVLVQPVGGEILKCHNEIRLAIFADLVGDAELEVLGVHECGHRQVVDVFQDVGDQPAGEDLGAPRP